MNIDRLIELQKSLDDTGVSAKAKARSDRNAIIEECARVAESCAVVTDYGREKIAAAIRHLKENPDAIKQEAPAIRALKDKP